MYYGAYNVFYRKTLLSKLQGKTGLFILERNQLKQIKIRIRIKS